MKISKELELPNDAVTQTFAQIGRRGAGKTYLASMIAEQMLDLNAQIIVIDPIGNWWGLRVDADGKSKGKNIFIVGGSHGDVPLSPQSGKEVAKLLAEKDISVVLDISEFRKNDRKTFVTDFAEEFYHLKKKNPIPVHIFLEESQKFVPQRVNKDEARMLGAWEDIVRLGRNCGIGCSLISQRPQSVNKEVLSQVECLCVLQVVGLQERKALEEWVQEAGEDRKLVGELPSLNRGEGYVWSPSWLKVFKKVNFSKKTTFDTSATPKLGEATKSAKISEMDINKLKDIMNKVIETSKKESLDKKFLIDEINRLKRELNSSSENKGKISKEDLQKSRAEGMNYQLEVDKKFYTKEIEKIVSQTEEAYKKEIKNLNFWYGKEIKDLQFKLNSIRKILGEELKETKMPKVTDVKISKPQIKIAEGGIEPRPLAYETKMQPLHLNRFENKKEEVFNSNGDSEKITGGALRMLKACAMFYPNQISKARMGAIAGLSYKSGTFGTYLSALKKNGLIEGEGNFFKITETGLDLVGEVEPIPTSSQELLDMWTNIIKGGASRMLEVLFKNYPNYMSREELGNESGLSGGSGTFGTYLSALKRNGLIEVNSSGIKCADEFFK